jgi:hypothetical protein
VRERLLLPCGRPLRCKLLRRRGNLLRQQQLLRQRRGVLRGDLLPDGRLLRGDDLLRRVGDVLRGRLLPGRSAVLQR